MNKTEILVTATVLFAAGALSACSDPGITSKCVVERVYSINYDLEGYDNLTRDLTCKYLPLAEFPDGPDQPGLAFLQIFRKNRDGTKLVRLGLHFAPESKEWRGGSLEPVPFNPLPDEYPDCTATIVGPGEVALCLNTWLQVEEENQEGELEKSWEEWYYFTYASGTVEIAHGAWPTEVNEEGGARIRLSGNVFGDAQTIDADLVVSVVVVEGAPFFSGLYSDEEN